METSSSLIGSHILHVLEYGVDEYVAFWGNRENEKRMRLGLFLNEGTFYVVNSNFVIIKIMPGTMKSVRALLFPENTKTNEGRTFRQEGVY